LFFRSLVEYQRECNNGWNEEPGEEEVKERIPEASFFSEVVLVRSQVLESCSFEVFDDVLPETAGERKLLREYGATAVFLPLGLRDEVLELVHVMHWEDLQQYTLRLEVVDAKKLVKLGNQELLLVLVRESLNVLAGQLSSTSVLVVHIQHFLLKGDFHTILKKLRGKLNFVGLFPVLLFVHVEHYKDLVLVDAFEGPYLEVTLLELLQYEV